MNTLPPPSQDANPTCACEFDLSDVTALQVSAISWQA
jgi:hypothetical protein